MILLGIAHTDLSRGVQGRDLARAELRKWPVAAIDLAAFDVAFLLRRGYGFRFSAIFLEWKRLLEALAVVFDSYPGTVGTTGFDDTDVMKCAKFFQVNLSRSMDACRADEEPLMKRWLLLLSL